MKKTLMAAVLCTLISGVSALAIPMPLDGTWIVLDQVATAPFLFSGGPWTWNVSSAVMLTVTDLAAATDRFDIYDNGVFVFETSNLLDTPGIHIDTPDAALASGYFSNGSWTFAGGVDHSITIWDIHVPVSESGGTYADGTVAFKASAVPDSGATVALLGTAFVGLAALGRKRLLPIRVSLPV